MESNLSQDGVPRPSYVFSADPVERPSGINFDGIKLDLSHEFSLVASNTEVSTGCEMYYIDCHDMGKYVCMSLDRALNFLALTQPCVSVTFPWSPTLKEISNSYFPSSTLKCSCPHLVAI
jgi:hypothetical protein